MEFEIICQDVLVVKTLSNAIPQVGIMDHMRKVNAALDAVGGLASGMELPIFNKAIPSDGGFSHYHIGEITVISDNRHEFRRVLASFDRKSDYGHVPVDEIWRDGKLHVREEQPNPMSTYGDIIITEPLSVISKVKSRITDDLAAEIAEWRGDVQSGATSADVAARYIFQDSAFEAFSTHRRRVLGLVDSDEARKIGIFANWHDEYCVYPEASQDTNFYMYQGFDPYALACLPHALIETLGADISNLSPVVIHFDNDSLG